MSVPAIVRRVEHAVAGGVESALARRANDPALDFDDVLEAARAGDNLALDVLEDVGNSLGQGLAVVVNLLNPPLIVVGGRLAQGAEVVLPLLSAPCAGDAGSGRSRASGW